MTLADLCSLLIERESVIHRFETTAVPARVGERANWNRIASAAERLGKFTRPELARAARCSRRAAKHWLEYYRNKLVVSGERVTLEGSAFLVWRWMDGAK